MLVMDQWRGFTFSHLEIMPSTRRLDPFSRVAAFPKTPGEQRTEVALLDLSDYINVVVSGFSLTTKKNFKKMVDPNMM